MRIKIWRGIFGHVFRIKGHGLIQPVNSIANRLKQMTLNHGNGITSLKHIEGGTIIHHRSP